MDPEHLTPQERDLLARCRRDHFAMAPTPSYVVCDLLCALSELRGRVAEMERGAAAYASGLSTDVREDFAARKANHGT